MQRFVTHATLAAGLALAACQASGPAPQMTPELLGQARQLVLVITADWDSTGGELRRFTRANALAAWREEGSAVPIVVGRKGLAWDGQQQKGAGPVKREGDGRAPAGVFAIGDAFGFAPPDSVRWIKLRYRQLTEHTDCVDDTASVHYNAIVERDALSNVDWNSSERMRQIALYRLGVVTEYNTRPAVKARGSCIFFHIWSGPQSTTAGCTAMAASRLEELLGWLDPVAHPVTVQLPRPVYDELRAGWRLP